MRVLSLALFSLAGLAAAQSQNASNGASVSTSLSTSVGLGADRQTTVQVITNLITITPTSSAGTPAASGNTTTTGNTTAPASGGNGTTSTSSTVSSNLPTANPSVDGGGNPAGAPSPGGASNGQYGPGDNYIAGALVVRVNAALVGLAGVAVGMVMVL